jgi:voltage-gated potassium channel
LNEDKEKLTDKQEGPKNNQPDGRWRRKLYEITFESNTRAGKLFDIILIFLILSNTVVIMLESIGPIYSKYRFFFKELQLFYTIIFTIEYILRFSCVKKPAIYLKSFYGVIDCLAILPSYLEIIFPHTHFLMLVRSFRLLRIFKIFKMVDFLQESRLMMVSLVKSYKKIVVFLSFIVLLSVLLGSIMYVLEYEKNPGFTSIPQSIYWAIVTITTVGYGDVAPHTALGKILATFIMILGYSIIAVPTGIISAKFIREIQQNKVDTTKCCPNCACNKHEIDAKYCRKCGDKLIIQD